MFEKTCVMNTHNNVFSQQITIIGLLKLFDDMATTITHEYKAEYIKSISEGFIPLFGDLLIKVKELNNVLREKAILIGKDYREQKGHMSIKLTTGCKRIIKKSLNDYIECLKNAQYK